MDVSEATSVRESLSRYSLEASLDEVPIGYSQTDIGIIPDDWECRPLRELTTRVGSGITPTGGARVYTQEGRPFLRSQNIGWGVLCLEDLAYITDEIHATFRASEIRDGDVLLNITGASIGRSAVADARVAKGNVNQHVCGIRTEPGLLDPKFLNAYLLSESGQRQIDSFQAGGNRQGLNYSQIRSFVIPRPPITEQHAIAEALSDVDRLLGALEALIAKKRDMNQAAMQQLLTGKTRLAGFSGTWERKKIIEIASLCGERNSPAKDLPVLTCSKHLGFIDSLSYFKNQVFSKNLSGYKVIRRGQIGYPANHIEEGSIGLQDLYDVALVSPIYVVFEPAFGVSSYFLHRLLKLDSYQQIFATATNSSVDRRGSLRWPAFSEITIELPPNNEQERIAKVLSDMDAEIGALEARLDKTRAIKQGMMQLLLTGRIRLGKPQPAEAEA